MEKYKIIRVNLSNRSINLEEVDENIIRKWLGGRGLGVYYSLKEINPKVNPLSDENKVMIFTGPLTGVPGVPLPGRITVVSKSPLNNRIAWSVGGGKFGTYLRMAGYLGIIIEGRSNVPLYLEIIDDKIILKDASYIWGKDVHETYNILWNNITKEYRVRDVSILSIGPAGENLVKFSSIMIEKAHSAGRMGFGAVLGYKKLKAIAVYGSKILRAINEEMFKNVSQELLRKVKNNEILKELSESGTLGMLIRRVGAKDAIPTHNFRQYMKIDKEKIYSEYKERIDPKESPKEFCWGCQIGCHKYVRTKIKELYYEGGNPEYWGGFVSLGSSLGISDVDFVIYAKGLCDRLGLDPISTGHVISNFIEIAKEKKIYDIDWGDKNKILELIEKIAYRKDIGNELAEGSEYIGKKYNYEVTTSKGIEIGLCHPQKAYGYNLALRTSNRGDHNQTMLKDEILLNRLDPNEKKGKVDYVIYMQNLFAILDSCVICIFASYALDFEDISKLLKAVCNLDISKEELFMIGERIYSAERYFNYLSLGYEIDKLPSRLSLDTDDLLKEYYEKRGWENGIPREDTLKKLEII